MREKVMALAQGKFCYEEPEIVVSTEKIELEVAEGSEAEAVLSVENRAHTKVKGFGATDEFNFEFLPVFDGKISDITVKVHAGNKKAGDCMKGAITLITDCGECEVPYEVQIVKRHLSGPKGALRSYDDFVNCAKENFDAAVEVFYQDKFCDIYLPKMHEKRLYHHLTSKNSKKQALEEFLVAHGDKKPMQFMANKAQLAFEVDEEDATISIAIAKTSWGMVGIKVSTDCPYLILDKQSLQTSDFVNEQATLSFTVKADLLVPGIHKGKIILENVYQKLEIGVRIHGVKGAVDRKHKRVGKQLTAGLVKSHIQYMMNSSLREQWVKLLIKHRENIQAYYPEQQLQLSGYVSFLTQSENEMKGFVNAVEGMRSPDYGEELEKVLKYLECSYVKCKINKSKDEKDVVCNIIKGYYENGYRHWELLVMLERLGYFQKNSRGFLEELDLLWEDGCFSPYLYFYRMMLILQEPGLVKQLDAKTISTLRFGLKHGLMTEELVIAISFLAAREKRFVPGLMALLVSCYETFHNKDTLHSICALLIRAEKQEKQYFKWFELGVQNRLRITELFEYYMYTLDKERFDEVLTDVISYFQYENHLRDSVKMQFYACIVKNREEHPEYFRVYSNAIRTFTLKQLQEHRINKEMAVLYEAFFTRDNVKDSVAKELPSVLFAHRLTCQNPNMERVVVVHDEGGGDAVYNLTNGEAQIALATPNYKLYFVDKAGYYHAGTVGYRLEKLLNLDSLAEVCYENGAEHPLLLLHLFSKALANEEIGTREAVILHLQVRRQVPGMEYRARALVALYDYYKTIGDDELLEEVLQTIDFEYVGQERHPGLLQTMIQHKMNDRALEMLRRYEILNCTKKLLLLLITWKLEESEGQFDPFHMKLCYYLYRHGVKNNTTLSYLINYYMGSADTLLDIYRVGAKNGVDIKDGGLERVLGQALFVSADPHKYADLFLEYYDYGANRILVKAFLAYTAYRYLVETCELDDKVREKIHKEGLVDDNPIMILAMLRYYSQQETYTDSEREFIEYHLAKYAAIGQIMQFMKAFIGKVEVPFEILHGELIQLFSSHQGETYIELQQDDAVVTQPMKMLFRDVYVYETLLFRGERIAYRIFAGDAEKPVKSGELVKADTSGKGDKAFYEMVNEMIEAKEQGEEERFLALAKDYRSRQNVAEKLFSPL